MGRTPSQFERGDPPDQWGSLKATLIILPEVPARLNDEDIEALSAEFGARVTLRMGAIQDDMVYCEKMPHVQDIRQWLSSAFHGVWSEWCDWLESQHRNPQEWLPIPLHLAS